MSSSITPPVWRTEFSNAPTVIVFLFISPCPSPKAFTLLNVQTSQWTYFISALPKVGELGSIIVVVDRFSKYATFIAAPTDCTAEETARLFVLIYKEQGYTYLFARWLHAFVRLDC